MTATATSTSLLSLNTSTTPHTSNDNVAVLHSMESAAGVSTAADNSIALAHYNPSKNCCHTQHRHCHHRHDSQQEPPEISTHEYFSQESQESLTTNTTTTSFSPHHTHSCHRHSHVHAQTDFSYGQR